MVSLRGSIEVLRLSNQRNLKATRLPRPARLVYLECCTKLTRTLLLMMMMMMMAAPLLPTIRHLLLHIVPKCPLHVVSIAALVPTSRRLVPTTSPIILGSAEASKAPVIRMSSSWMPSEAFPWGGGAIEDKDLQHQFKYHRAASRTKVSSQDRLDPKRRHNFIHCSRI
jgi:hypothetical protein